MNEVHAEKTMERKRKGEQIELTRIHIHTQRLLVDNNVNGWRDLDGGDFFQGLLVRNDVNDAFVDFHGPAFEGRSTLTGWRAASGDSQDFDWQAHWAGDLGVVRARLAQQVLANAFNVVHLGRG